MSTFTAVYAGECVECDGLITPGDEINQATGGYRHHVCPVVDDELANAAALKHPRCTRCFTHHPGDC